MSDNVKNDINLKERREEYARDSPLFCCGTFTGTSAPFTPFLEQHIPILGSQAEGEAYYFQRNRKQAVGPAAGRVS